MAIDVSAVLRAQKSFFSGGQPRTLSFRKHALDLLLHQIRIHQEALLSALQADLGKSQHESMLTEITPTIKELELCRRKLRAWSAGHYQLAKFKYLPSRVRQRREPYGVVLIISTWSLPLQLSLIPLINAVAAGNCVLLKPSELAPHTGRVIGEICREVFPPQYVQVLEGGSALGERLCEENFDFIFYCGNAFTGREVAMQAARRLTPVSLQLGGKSPCIVTAHCNMEQAAEQIVLAKMQNVGQNCLAPDYILLQKQARDSFLEVLTNKLREHYGVDPLNDPAWPPIVSKEHFHRLAELMKSGRIVWGGRMAEQSLKIEPTILDNISWQDPVMQQEIFGPLIPVLVFDQLITLVQQLNRLPHPLTAYLFSTRKQDIDLVQQHLICGSCQINATRRHYEQYGQAYGGVGLSGYGHYRGKAGFDLFSYPRVDYICHAAKFKALTQTFDEEANTDFLTEEDL